MHRLILGDCREILKTFTADIGDLVLTDPPYQISRDNNFGTMGRAGIDFGEWDVLDLSFIGESFRILKSGGSFICFNGWRNLGLIAGEAESCGFVCKDMLRFIKTNPMPRNRDRRYIVDYECALWFVKPGKWKFNRGGESYRRPEYRSSIAKGFHPTQKPVKIMREIIKVHSDEGDLVIDPFMGAGSTGIAAKQLGRRFWGIEQNGEYFGRAVHRFG